MVGTAAPRNPLSRNMNIRNSPSLDDLNIIAKTQTRLPQVNMYDPLTFNKTSDARARSLSSSQPRGSSSSSSSSASKLKSKPFAGMKRPAQVSQAAFPRPNASKYDQSYLSAFAGTPEKSSPSKGKSGSRGAAKPFIDTTGRGSPVTRDMASSLFDSATGLKLQMLKMVRDLNTNQDRSDAARDILRDLGSDPAKPHVDEKIFVNFYKSVQTMKTDVGQEIGEVRAEMRDIFAMLDSDRELMEEDLAEMETEAVEMQRVVTKMNGAISKFEMEVGRA
ncbi:unnamed protein product [Amoebophrya sp. A120]|nr:unnamed protein product [Amoebophrya sp. A120]|eukprot:GSA120T00010939001.1